MITRTLIRIFPFALMLASAGLSATTLEFRDGVDILLDGASTGVIYNGTHDAELRESAPNNNFDNGTGSSDPEFTADLIDGGGEAQVVLRFDDIFGASRTNVPFGSIINSATLFIDIDDNGSNLELYELTSDFGTESSVTWLSFGGGVTPGANAQSSLTTTINGGGNKVTIDITSSVAAWAAGATNYGWAFIATGSNGVDFDASENSDFA
ncbi:MAG: hypothetical protein ACI9BW_003107, partial [Gammaproteobacteria bacterium]